MEIDDLADTRDTVDTVVAEFENLDSRVGQTDFSNLRSWSEPSTASVAAHFDGTEASDSRIPLHKRKWSTGVAAVDASARKQMKAESTSAMETANRMMVDDGETSEEIAVSDEDQHRAHDWIHSFKAMSLTQQSFAIQSLVRALSDPQVRSMRHLIEPLFQKDFLSQLPEEIAFHVITYLTPCDLTACAGVSRTWQRLCEDDRTWRRKCLDNGYVKPDAPSFRFLGGWAANRANEQAGITIFSHMDLQEAHQNRREREIAYGQCYERSSWKSLYLRKKRIISNWRSRAIQSSTVLKGHDEHVITCLQIHSGRIVTGSDDNTLRVWNVDDAQPAFTLTGHMGGVWTSQVSDDGKYIVSGSTDRTVRVWCGQTGVQRHVLQGHTSTVRCMSLHGTTLVSGSRDQTLRVWDIVDGKCLHILTGHLAAVRCVQFDGKRVVSGAYDFTVKVWNVHTEECLHTLTGHTNRVYSLLFEPERDLVVSGSLDTTIRVWDVRRGRCIAILVGHQSLTSGMQLRGNILVSCNADSDVRVWDIRDGGSCTHHLHGVNGHTSAITSLQLLDSGLLATSSDDGSVKLWDVDKGIFVRDLVRLQSGGSGGCIWRLKATETLLVCAVGSRNGTEDTKLILIDFDAAYP